MTLCPDQVKQTHRRLNLFIGADSRGAQEGPEQCSAEQIPGLL